MALPQQVEVQAADKPAGRVLGEARVGGGDYADAHEPLPVSAGSPAPAAATSGRLGGAGGVALGSAAGGGAPG